MLTTILLLLAIVYLPGAVIFRLPIADRSKRAALPAEERAFWMVMISVVVSTSLAFVLAAGGIYSLTLLAACNGVLAAVFAVAFGRGLRLGAATRPGWTALLPAVLVGVGVWMYFGAPAAEYLLGGRDPGVYMNEGIQIAQQRSLVTTDRTVTELPDLERALFFPPQDDRSYYGLRFMGFHLRDPVAGTVSGQFPQGYPLWVAMAYGLDGVTGARRVTAWWAIFGVLAVYFAGTRLIGRFPAFAAAALLSVHVIQTWYARYPNSEIVTQALIFGALLAHAYAHQDDDRFFGPIAASLFGLALLTRLPVVLAVGTAVVASALGRVNGQRVPAGFMVTLGIWMSAAGVYYLTQLRPYFNRPLEYLLLLQPIHDLALALAGIAIGVLLWAIRKPAIASAVRVSLPVALIVAVIAGGMYALFLREPAGRLAPHDALALRMFANLYFIPAAVVIALGGYALVVAVSFWRAPAMILTTTTFLFLFFFKIRIIPEHFWLTRRFVDIILPAALLFLAAAALMPFSSFVSQPWAASRRAAAARIVAGAVILVLIGRSYVEASDRVRTHVEYAGLIPKLEQLAGRFQDDDLVLVEAREASDVHALALPLAYVYARNVLVLATSRPDKPAVARFLKWAWQRYEHVYFIAGGGTDLLSPGVGATIVDTERFQVPEYEKSVYDVYPRSTPLKPFDFTIYQLVSAEATAPPVSVDVGGADDLYLVGFYPKERLGGGTLTFRWTQDASHLLMGIRPGSRELVLRLQSGRPQGVATPRVTVYVEGQEVGTAAPSGEFREYAFPIPSALVDALARRSAGVDIRIESSTWMPSKALGGVDNRALGVMLDSADIR